MKWHLCTEQISEILPVNENRNLYICCSLFWSRPTWGEAIARITSPWEFFFLIFLVFFILGGGSQFINEQSYIVDNQLVEELNKDDQEYKINCLKFVFPTSKNGRSAMMSFKQKQETWYWSATGWTFKIRFPHKQEKMKTGTRNKDHLHNMGLLQAAPRFLVLPPGMLANANNPGNAK